jgi:uncharacterized protein YraI
MALVFCLPVALAQPATTTTSVTVRAGPARSMPNVTTLLSNTSVNVVGCVANWSWCEVIAGRERGWVYTRYLSVVFEGRAMTIVNGGPHLGLPVVEFALGPYWDEHYTQRLWFAQKATWQRRWDQQRPPSPWREPTPPRS